MKETKELIAAGFDYLIGMKVIKSSEHPKGLMVNIVPKIAKSVVG